MLHILCSILKGDCHGTAFKDLAIKFPGIFTPHKGPLDFTWRYPGGEVKNRLAYFLCIGPFLWSA